jgi:hypothetical protein
MSAREGSLHEVKGLAMATCSTLVTSLQPRFKLQGPRFKVQGVKVRDCLYTVQRSRFKGQGSFPLPYPVLSPAVACSSFEPCRRGGADGHPACSERACRE